MPEPVITVVIPVRNRPRLIIEALDSIYAQHDVWPIRVIVVDNHSIDGTNVAVGRWIGRHSNADFRVALLYEPRIGASFARNRGLSEVTTPYVMFFDSDDLMLPGHLARITSAAIASDCYPQIIGYDVLCRDVNDKLGVLKFYDKDYMFNHIFRGSLSTARYVATTSLITSVGGWNETLTGWDDYELGLRMLVSLYNTLGADMNSAIMKLSGECTVMVRQRFNSISGMPFSNDPKAWERALDSCTVLLQNSCDDVIYRRYIELRRVVLAASYEREGAHDEASRLLGEVVDREYDYVRKQIFRKAYRYTVRGHRGIHHLTKWFL